MARQGHKKLTNWEYRDREVCIVVPVTLVNEEKTTSGGEETYFQVRMSEPEINEKDTDINRLKQTVFAKIKDKIAIEWRSMLVVGVSMNRERLFEKKKKPNTPDTDREGGGALKLYWSRVQIAQYGRKKLQRDFSNYYAASRSFHDRKPEPPREVWERAREGWPEVGADKPTNRDRSQSIRAMIPDTPENRVALEAIADNIERLYLSLGRLLSSNQIEQTLAQVAAAGLLALPSK